MNISDFQQINTANEILSDPDKRHAYDQAYVNVYCPHYSTGQQFDWSSAGLFGGVYYTGSALRCTLCNDANVFCWSCPRGIMKGLGLP
jgi:hypothetical protein